MPDRERRRSARRSRPSRERRRTLPPCRYERFEGGDQRLVLLLRPDRDAQEIRKSDAVTRTDDDAALHQVLVRALGHGWDAYGNEVCRGWIRKESQPLVLREQIRFAR